MSHLLTPTAKLTSFMALCANVSTLVGLGRAPVRHEPGIVLFNQTAIYRVPRLFTQPLCMLHADHRPVMLTLHHRPGMLWQCSPSTNRLHLTVRRWTSHQYQWSRPKLVYPIQPTPGKLHLRCSPAASWAASAPAVSQPLPLDKLCCPLERE